MHATRSNAEPRKLDLTVKSPGQLSRVSTDSADLVLPLEGHFSEG